MINFITDKVEFEKYKIKINEIFPSYISFENNPFNANFKYFIGFDFDFIFNDHFFEGIRAFLLKIGDKKLFFYTIDPHPEDYFHKHFNCYNAFEANIKTLTVELNDIMMKDPGDSPADSIAIHSDQIVWFSQSSDWAILGSRDFEIAVAGFTSEDIKLKFIDSFNDHMPHMLTSVVCQIKLLNDMLHLKNDIKEEYFKLQKKYEDR